ncbi:MAG: hypothetical protein AAFX06_22590 [Planctomycetota bacterium]
MLARLRYPLFLATAFLCHAAVAQLPVIQLHALSRSVFQPGEEADIHLLGASIEEVAELRISHPGISAELVTGAALPFDDVPVPKFGYFRLRVAEDVPPGRYEVRAVGRFGLSNPRSILIGARAEFVTAISHDKTSAALCQFGVLYHRHASPQRSDVYWANVNPGQVIRVALMSKVVDSRLRGSVTVSDESGRVIDSAVGDASGDVFRSISIPQGVSRIAIAVEDLLYRGGPQYGYVLGLSREDQQDEFGTLIEPQDARCVSARFGNAQPMAESTDPIRITIPTVIDSEFDSATDKDQYLCSLDKGQTLTLACYSDRLGEPTDTRIVVHRSITDGQGNVSWQRVAAGDDCQAVSDTAVNLNSRDTELTWTAPEQGDYRITVSDQDTGEFLSKRQRYVLSIDQPKRDPILFAYHLYPHRDINTTRPSGVHVPRGGSAVVRVFALRRGYSGPIEVSLKSLPTGLTCVPGTITPDRSQTDLIVHSAADTPAVIQAVEVIGKINLGDGTDEANTNVIAVPVSVLWERNGQQPKIRTRVMDQLWLHATDQDTLPVALGPSSDQPVEVVKGNKVKVAMKVARTDGTKNNVIFRARNLPAGVKAGDLTVGGDKTDAEWTIDVTAGTKAGTYRFWSQAETKVKFAVNPQALTRETEYHAKLTKFRADPARADKHAELDQAIAESNKRIEAIKKQTAPRDFTIFVATPVITLNVKEK